MTKRGVQPDGVFDAAEYGFSQGVLVDGVLYVSGQVSMADGLAAQVAEAWASVVAVVEAAGGTVADIAKLTVFTRSDEAWGHLQPLVTAAIDPPYPAATMVTVVGLANPEFLVEIEAIAVIAFPGHATSSPRSRWTLPRWRSVARVRERVRP
ncbi:MAG: RidA family protein [Ilumatobacteraceae bacterium]